MPMKSNVFHFKSIQTIVWMLALVFGMNMQAFAQGQVVTGIVTDDLNDRVSSYMFRKTNAEITR